MKPTPMRSFRQTGGTLIGFVVGLLVGLGLALAVAIYVTKVPVPFVDRGVSRKPEQDVMEAERNKGWNPNAALGGKAVTGSVPATGSETAGAISVPPADGEPLPAPTRSTPAAGSTTATVTASKPAKASPTADPLGELMQSRTGTPATSVAKGTASNADPFTYFVQAGAFKTPEDAEAQRAKLAMMGMAAEVSEREQSGRTVFRVRVGPFSDKALAEATREQLEVGGVEAALVRVQR